MATSAEKQELIEDIKRPTRYYRIQLWGYGGESAYLSLTKQQYNYWKDRDEEEYDSTITYMLDENREEVDVPPEVDFLGDPDDPEGARYPWYEASNEIAHQYGVDYSSARISITEIESEDYNAKIISDIVDGIELSEFVDQHNITWISGEPSRPQSDYMLQFYSSEKGTFFDAILTVAGKIDFSKLTINSTEYYNGDDTVEDIEYDGEDIENFGAETNGKGYSVSMWKNI